MKILAMSVAVSLQMAVTAKFGSKVAHAYANNDATKHTKL
jgi:hypothetical protein